VTKRPNIVVILADDLGFSDLGCYGAEHIQTPNLDALAHNGLRYTNFYNTARCWPTRISLMTGYHFQQTNLKRSRLPCLPQYLAPLGYRSYHSGKWHVHGTKPVGHAGFARSYWLRDHNRFFKPKTVSIDDERVASPKERYVTRAKVDFALECLKEHRQRAADSPFFLYLAFTAPHFPLHAEQADIDIYRDKFLEGWDAIRTKRHANQKRLGLLDAALPPTKPDLRAPWSWKSDRLRKHIHTGEGYGAVAWDSLDGEAKRYQATKMAIHAAMVHRLDREVGRLIAYLKETGQFDNTLIVFFSDNGASAEQIIRGDMHDKSAPLGSQKSYLCLGPGWSAAANTPLQYHKFWTHEGGACTPFIAHWPAGIEGKGVVRPSQQGHVTDLLPTLVAAAGGQAKSLSEKAPPLPGKNLLASFTNGEVVDQEFIYLNHGGNKALRMGDWKAVMTPRYGDKSWELYNLGADRTEMRDLAKEDPERLERMKQKWESLTRQYDKDKRSQAKTAETEPAVHAMKLPAGEGEVILAEDFDGDRAKPLNGTAPDSRIGEATWIASPHCKADGSHTPGRTASAFLPLRPVTGKVYSVTLDLEVTSGGHAWFALSLCKGSAAGGGILAKEVGATGWMLARHNSTRNGAVQTFVGPGTRGKGQFHPQPALKPERRMRLVLDTRAPRWQVTWFINGQKAGRTVALPTDTNIKYIGISSNGQATGVLKNLKVSELQEPQDTKTE